MQNAECRIREAASVNSCFHSSFSIQHSAFDDLARMDSNHDKQNQNLLCYRYTTGQNGTDERFEWRVESEAKGDACRRAGQGPGRGMTGVLPIADELPEARAD